MHDAPLRHWQRAREYLGRGQLPAANRELDVLLSLDPHGTRTHMLCAQIRWREQRISEATEAALAAAQADASDPDTAMELITTLRMTGETARAHEVFENTAWQPIQSADTLYRYAIMCQSFGQAKRALATFEQLLDTAPDNAMLHFLRAQQLEFLGRLEDAGDAYEACLAKSPGLGYAAYKLARLWPQTKSARLTSLIDSGLRNVQPRTSGRADFEFARYHLLEGNGQTDQAWQALERANKEMHGLYHADSGAHEQWLQQACTRMAEWSIPSVEGMAEGPCPIFIIGMPRSGTTLLERMLGNHSQITAAGELIDFSSQLLHVVGHHDVFGEHGVSRMNADACADLGRRYLAQTAWRAAGKPYFVDKQPNNWSFVGLIRAALPQAKILHVVRDPMDTCFSIWRARFADAHGWSYDLDDLATHFRSYHRMMRHWQHVCPDAMHTVDYEHLIKDPVATLREVMAFCGLAWEAGCEDPSRNHAPVSTLSSSQVREAVNTRSLGRWRRYAEPLEPWREPLSR